jgi:hypothetical protein
MKLTRILALVLAVLTVTAVFASCGKTPDPETTAAPDTTAAAGIDDTTAAAIPADDTTAEAAPTEAPATEAPATEATTEAAATTEAPTETTTAATTTTTTEPTTEEKKAPTDKAEILKVYNDATAKVMSKKVAFSKRRETKEGSFDAGLVLKGFKSVVYKFMGIGAENVYTQAVAKNDGSYDHYFKKSTLTTSDINDATCKLNSDGSYDITIKVKSGNSYTAGGSSEKYYAPLDKCGISAGQGDKGYWDHKTAQNMYAALSEVAKDAVVDEKYSNATVKATIDKDGNLTKLDVSFDIDVNIDKVYGQSGHATGSSVVNFSGFKW